MYARERLREAVRLGIDDEIDAAWRYSVTRLERWRATGAKPSDSNRRPKAAVSGAVY